MTMLKKRRAKKAEKLVIDFTVTATRVYSRRRSHMYLHLRDEEGEGLFLTLEPGSVSVVRCPLIIPDGAHHSVYRVQFGRDDFEDLEPRVYDFETAVRNWHSSQLGRTAGAEREMRAILGLEALEESVSDADLAVQPRERKRTRKEPSEARAEPRERQPGGYTLQSLCEELGIDPTEARKHLRRSNAQKPGGRWEWPSAEAAASIRALLEAMPKE